MQFFRVSVLPFVLLALLVFLQYRLWFEAGGMGDVVRLKKRLAAEQQVNNSLKKNNQTLLVQVQQLQKNQDAIEARARQELGMVKKDETFYQTVK